VSEIGDYLMRNYYNKYNPADYGLPQITKEMVEMMVEKYADKIVVIRNPDIKGVAVYMTLTDITYENLDLIDLSDPEVIAELLKEEGNNLHFFMVCGSSVKNILQGIREVKRRHKPKTISWFNQDLSYLHKYNMN